MIGPLWCVESNAWLRFSIVQNGLMIAESASIDAHHPVLATPWTPVAQSTWHVLASPSLGNAQHAYYCLDNGFLYRYEGVSKLTQAPVVSKFSPEEATWKKVKENPFAAYIRPSTQPADGFQFPLTPEQQEEIWHTLQHTDLYTRLVSTIEGVFDEEQRHELLSFLPVALAQFNAKNFPTFDSYLAALRDVLCNIDNVHRASLVQQASRTVDYVTLADSPIDQESLFFMKKNFFLDLLAAVYNHIRQAFGLPIERFERETPMAIPPAPHMAITDDPFYFDEEPREDDFPAAMAAQYEEWQREENVEAVPYPPISGLGLPVAEISTLVDSMFDEAQRQDLLAQLLSCMEGVLSRPFRNLSDYYDALMQVIHNGDNAYHQAIEAIAFHTTTLADQELNPQHSLAVAEDLRKAKLAFFFDILRAESQRIGQNITMSRTIAAAEAQYHQDPYAGQEGDYATPNDRSDTFTLEDWIDDGQDPHIIELKTAVTTAKNRYMEWYNSQQPHRGANGFFSWLRHGAYGQNRAKALHQDISIEQESRSIIVKINEFLTDENTRYHRHSFASFLLDELITIQNAPWTGLGYIPSSNLYDKEAVSTHVGPQAQRYALF